jgi:DNA-binding response OmpR family regulator
MKILIHDERTDALEFLMGSIVNYGYRAGIAKDSSEIMNMMSDDRYQVVLTNGSYEELDLEQRIRMKLSPAFIIGIKDPQRSDRDEETDPAVDLCLQRPFEASRLRLALESRGKTITNYKAQ